MSSKRQQVLDAITTKLALITTGNGYSMTVKSVTAWRKKPLTISDLPAIIVQDMAASVDYESSGTGEITHHLAIEIGLFTNGTSTASNCRNGMADIVKSLGPQPSLSLSFDAWLELTAHELAMEIDGDICGAGRVTLQATYISSNLEI